MGSHKSVILLWMAGGPSHIDTWDPKPGAPVEIRGPFATIPTKLAGIRFCEHYPKQAAMMDRLTLIRSMVCRGSNHQPNQVMQTANPDCEPRTNPAARHYPAIGSFVAKHHGANDPQVPPYVALNVKDRTHIAWGGYSGSATIPSSGTRRSICSSCPGLTMERLESRRSLHEQMDTLRSDIDLAGSMEGLDAFGQQAFDLVAGAKAQPPSIWAGSPPVLSSATVRTTGPARRSSHGGSSRPGQLCHDRPQQPLRLGHLGHAR